MGKKSREKRLRREGKLPPKEQKSRSHPPSSSTKSRVAAVVFRALERLHGDGPWPSADIAWATQHCLAKLGITSWVAEGWAYWVGVNDDGDGDYVGYWKDRHRPFVMFDDKQEGWVVDLAAGQEHLISHPDYSPDPLEANEPSLTRIPTPPVWMDRDEARNVLGYLPISPVAEPEREGRQEEAERLYSAVEQALAEVEPSDYYQGPLLNGCASVEELANSGNEWAIGALEYASSVYGPNPFQASGPPTPDLVKRLTGRLLAADPPSRS